MDAGAVNVVPSSTYRLQFSSRFGFKDAIAAIPYLAELGVGAIYASPYLRARPGSEHGYDVVDHNSLNPEIGTEAEHEELIATAQAHGIGHILDFVPNHMGIHGMDNGWWADVLEWGQQSPYAKFFDIDWHPRRSDLDGKVLLPFLGDHYGRVLERGELSARFDSDRKMFVVSYFDLTFPLAPPTYESLLMRAADLNGGRRGQLAALARQFAKLASDREARKHASELKNSLTKLLGSDTASAAALERALSEWKGGNGAGALDRLHKLIDAQHYRLASWRVSLHEINYRRFFNINELAGLRVEDAEVLAQTHRFIFGMIADHRLQGLRIDHVDGLFNPGGYCRLLRERASVLDQPLYLVVEKILARFERLSSDWRVDGTTGYDFMNDVNELFVNPRSEAAFDRVYGEYAGVEELFDDVAYTAKQYIIQNVLSSELTFLATTLFRIALSDLRSSDFTYDGLRDAVAAVVASFPVYRTYITESRPNEEDRRYIEWAVVQAAKRNPLADESIFTFVGDVLTEKVLELPNAGFEPNDVLRFIMKFQQYTGPVMAKAVEDTAFYRYVRLLSLNEVGGDPRRFGTSVEAFHRRNVLRAEDFPRTMLATATHDHKRGEDTRLRISALSEMPVRWRKMLNVFGRIGKPTAFVESLPAPSKKDQYAIYQMLVGTLPMAWLNRDERPPQEEIDEYLERLLTWVRKAVREAKTHSSWERPNEAYERPTMEFVRNLFDGPASRQFFRELRLFTRDVALVAMISGLSQLTLRLTCPGVPDTYQGTELWDLSMVDPDNRRDVDFTVRRRLLSEIRSGFDREENRSFLHELLRNWPDGRVKLLVTWRLLQLRRQFSALFQESPYQPLPVRGRHSASLVAFARRNLIVVAPRLVSTILQRSGDGAPRLDFAVEEVVLPRAFPHRYTNVFTKGVCEAKNSAHPVLAVRDLLRDFPVAVLVPD